MGKSDERTELTVPRTNSGTIHHIQNFESKVFEPRNVSIWLPESYHPSKEYAVLYMQDGQMLFDAAITWNKLEWRVDEVLNQLILDGAIKPCIVVGIWNNPTTRHSDYFPQKVFNNLPSEVTEALRGGNTTKQGAKLFSQDVRSDRYLSFIVNELKPYVDDNYAVKIDAKNTIVAGSSMGGLISLYAFCEYPEVFRKAICMSTHWTGTHDVNNNPIPNAIFDYLNANIPNPEHRKIYFDYGTETLDALYEPYQTQVDTLMLKHGYSKEHMLSLKFDGDEHSEKAWSKRFNVPVKFLLG